MKQTTILIISLLGAVSVFRAAGQGKLPGLALIPTGRFEMGEHRGFVDSKHGGDETLLRTVNLGAFRIGTYDVTTADYPGRINLNRTGRALKRDWLHCHSIDYNAQSWFVGFSFVAPLAFDRPLS
jgi:formylglycine-generating enzyme required for sulfatase activity